MACLVDEILKPVPAVFSGQRRRQRQMVQRHARRAHPDAGRGESLYIATGGGAQSERVAQVAAYAHGQLWRPRRPLGPDLAGCHLGARVSRRLAGMRGVGGDRLLLARLRRHEAVEQAELLAPKCPTPFDVGGAVGAVEIGVCAHDVRTFMSDAIEDVAGDAMRRAPWRGSGKPVGERTRALLAEQVGKAHSERRRARM